MLADKLNILPRNIHVSHGSLLSVHVHCKLVDTTDMSTSQSLDTYLDTCILLLKLGINAAHLHL